MIISTLTSIAPARLGRIQLEYWRNGVLRKAMVAGCRLRVARPVFQPATRNTQLVTGAYQLLAPSPNPTFFNPPHF